jgi:hypothetical protein
LLVIRAWVQEGSERPLRVEVRLTADSGRGFEGEFVFSEPAAVEALVRIWLDDVLVGGDRARQPAGRLEWSRDGHATVTRAVDDAQQEPRSPPPRG